MNQPAKTPEPSMEEILASIRRIIADEDVPKAKRGHAPSEPAPADAVATEPMRHPPVFDEASVEDSLAQDSLAQDPLAQDPLLDEPLANDPGIEDPGEDAYTAEYETAAQSVSSGSDDDTEEPDVLELTEEMHSEQQFVAAYRSDDAEPDPIFSDPQFSVARAAGSDPSAIADHLESARRALAEQMEPPLLSRSTSAAVDHAFSSLAQTVLAQNARTVDDLVKEMLRPMLKAWLDDNLPGLVERLVRAEIERVSRGR